MKFVAEKNLRKNDILSWILPFGLSITFWICLFPQGFIECWWAEEYSDEQASMVPALADQTL